MESVGFAGVKVLKRYNFLSLHFFVHFYTKTLNRRDNLIILCTALYIHAQLISTLSSANFPTYSIY